MKKAYIKKKFEIGKWSRWAFILDATADAAVTWTRLINADLAVLEMLLSLDSYLFGEGSDHISARKQVQKGAAGSLLKSCLRKSLGCILTIQLHAIISSGS